jgi:hypothetical protein
MTSGIDDAERCNGIVLNTEDPVDNNLLQDLRADARIDSSTMCTNSRPDCSGFDRLRSQM